MINRLTYLRWNERWSSRTRRIWRGRRGRRCRRTGRNVRCGGTFRHAVWLFRCFWDDWWYRNIWRWCRGGGGVALGAGVGLILTLHLTRGGSFQISTTFIMLMLSNDGLLLLLAGWKSWNGFLSNVISCWSGWSNFTIPQWQSLIQTLQNWRVRDWCHYIWWWQLGQRLCNRIGIGCIGSWWCRYVHLFSLFIGLRRVEGGSGTTLSQDRLSLLIGRIRVYKHKFTN